MGLCANPALGGGRRRLGGGCRVVLGGGPVALRAELDSIVTGQGEQEEAVSNHLGTPIPREGKQLARATQKPVREPAVQCLSPSLLF